MQNKRDDKLYCGVDRYKIEQAHPAFNYENIDNLFWFIIKRYRIHVRKDILNRPYPWTNDPVLQKYKFTNVFREDDRVSRALIDQVSTNSELSLEEKILNTFFFRVWNNPLTFRDFGGPWNKEQIYNGLALKEKVRKRYRALLKKDPKRLWWSNAYNMGGTKRMLGYPSINGPDEGDGNCYESDIPLRVFHIGPWLKECYTVKKLLKAKSQQKAFEAIKEIPGFSNFLAYQVFVDLTYIEDYKFSENEFVVAGPGCQHGLDLVFTDFDGMTYEESLFYLRDNIAEVFSEAGHPEWNPERLFRHRDESDRCLNIMSLENCFCELSKYVRAVTGTGRPHNRYRQKKTNSKGEKS